MAVAIRHLHLSLCHSTAQLVLELLSPQFPVALVEEVAMAGGGGGGNGRWW